MRWIFNAYLEGRSVQWITEALRARGTPSHSVSGEWMEAAVRYVLRNEKYIGDSLCQKYFNSGFPFAHKENQGERPQYYIENSHPPSLTGIPSRRYRACCGKGLNEWNSTQRTVR